MRHQQECIPVGCVLSAAVALCWRGEGAWSRGCLVLGGLVLRDSGPGGVAWSWEGPWSWGGLVRGGPGLGGWWGVCLVLGGGIPACTEADPPPVDRQTGVET